MVAASWGGVPVGHQAFMNLGADHIRYADKSGMGYSGLKIFVDDPPNCESVGLYECWVGLAAIP